MAWLEAMSRWQLLSNSFVTRAGSARLDQVRTPATHIITQGRVR
jgi:hypothetical protein